MAPQGAELARGADQDAVRAAADGLAQLVEKGRSTLSLRSVNHPETTRYNYLLAAGQRAGGLAGYPPDPEADDAADNPTEVTRDHVEAFQAWMIETRSASTAVNKHKALRVFFGWLLDDEREIDRSPWSGSASPRPRPS